MAIVLAQQLGIGMRAAALKAQAQMGGDGAQYARQIQRFARDLGQRNDRVTQVAWSAVGMVIDVESQAKQIQLVDPLTEQAGEFPSLVLDVVGPLQLNVRIRCEFGGG